MQSKDFMTEFSPIVREFAIYKSTVQLCSEKTVCEYLLDLRTFFRYLLASDRDIDMESSEFEKIDVSAVDLERLGKVTPEDIYYFLDYTKNGRKNRWSANSRKLAAIRALYKFICTRKRLLKTNPAQDVDNPRIKRSLPKVLSLNESIDLLEAVEQDEDSANRVRDFAIITLFLNCGMRVSELVGINVNDLDSELCSLRVIGKGSKERIIYLNDACRSALNDYLDVRNSREYKKLVGNPLFISRLERRISVKTVQALVYKYLKEAGLETKHYSVHKLRHTAATLMYQSGKVDVRVLKDILGHEQLNTTQIYAHVSNQSMEDAMNENPLAERKRKK